MSLPVRRWKNAKNFDQRLFQTQSRRTPDSRETHRKLGKLTFNFAGSCRSPPVPKAWKQSAKRGCHFSWLSGSWAAIPALGDRQLSGSSIYFPQEAQSRLAECCPRQSFTSQSPPVPGSSLAWVVSYVQSWAPQLCPDWRETAVHRARMLLGSNVAGRSTRPDSHFTARAPATPAPVTGEGSVRRRCQAACGPRLDGRGCPPQLARHPIHWPCQ